VNALNGAPGVYSARFAGDHASDSDNVTKLLSRLEKIPWEDRNARFRCLMVYLRRADDPAPLICEGTWSGVVTQAPSGQNGFGYDPVFWVPDEGCTAAELDSERKNGLSHRARALRMLMERLKESAGAP